MRRLGLVMAAAALVAPSSVLAQVPQTATAVKDSNRYGPWVASTIKPGVHLLAAAPDWFGPVVGNVTLVEQSDGWVVIDSGLSGIARARSGPLSPARCLASRSRRWRLPIGTTIIRRAVSAIRDAFPNVRIIATSGTEKGMLGPESFEVDLQAQSRGRRGPVRSRPNRFWNSSTRSSKTRPPRPTGANG